MADTHLQFLRCLYLSLLPEFSSSSTSSTYARCNILLFVDDPHLAMLRLPVSRVVPVLNTFIS